MPESDERASIRTTGTSGASASASRTVVGGVVAGVGEVVDADTNGTRRLSK